MGALKRGNCVLPKSLGPTSEGSKISLSQALRWVSDISIEGLAVGKETSFSFNLCNESRPWTVFLLNRKFWTIISSISSSSSS